METVDNLITSDVMRREQVSDSDNDVTRYCGVNVLSALAFVMILMKLLSGPRWW